jgi:hypothetical protein
MFIRPVFQAILSRVQEPRRFIQVLMGPRQVGKTTLTRQVAEAVGLPVHYASADEPGPKDHLWVQQQWNIARLATEQGQTPALFILDEVQKVADWTAVVKQLWDEDSFNKIPLKVILLGSAPLSIQHGLSESLAGRFELIRIPHWSLAEMQQAFDFTLSQYIYFGGYPGAAPLIADENRWKQYILDAMVETTISRDILSHTTIQKPALLRRLFHLGCQYSGQILSFQKMMGQLQDAGNTTTLAHYLELLTNAGLLAGVNKYAGQIVRQRASSPKLQVLNTSLMSAQLLYSFAEAQKTPDIWGHLVESAVGTHLMNTTLGSDIDIFYWRENQQEVDFILQKGDKLVALEVKSGARKMALPGITAFQKSFPHARVFLIGGQGLSIEKFLNMSAGDLFNI